MQSENERKQKWLWRYQNSRRAEARIRKQILDEMDRATATTKALSPVVVSGGSGNSKIEEAVAIMQERQQKLYTQLIETEVIRSEIEQAISSIPAGLMQDILLERYIVGTPYWWMIANNLHISEKWARENHRKAIDALKI